MSKPRPPPPMLGLTWIITEVGNQSPYIKFFDLGDGFKPFLMIFSESRDDFRYDMHFYEIFWRFMVSEGSPRENPPNDPKNYPQKWDFPIKWQKVLKNGWKVGGNGWKHVLNHFPHFSPIFWHFLSIYCIFAIFEGFFGVLWKIFPKGPLRNHKSSKNFIKMHVIPKIIPRFRKTHKKSV